MSDFFNQKGDVRIVLGKGYISLYEASNLEEGDIFRVSRQAGDSVMLYFNNSFFCTGEIVVIDDHFGFRVTGFENNYPDPIPIIKDHITELLPTEIQLDSIQLSIKELKGIIIGSIIGFEKEVSENEDAELAVAGIPIAAGKTLIIKESFGIRLTKIYNTNKEKSAIRSSGYRIDPNLLDFKLIDYDFRKPDKFSWEILLRIKEIHNMFIENLKLSLPEVKNIKVLSSDQAAFFALFDHVNKKDLSYIVIDTDTRRSLPETVAVKNYIPDAKLLLFQENSKNPALKNKKLFDRVAKHEYDKYPFPAKMVIHYRNTHPFSWIKDENSINEFLIPSLRNAWKSVTGINFKLEKMSSDFNDYKIINDTYLILLVYIGVEGKPEEGFMTLVYPFITLEPIMPLLSK